MCIRDRFRAGVVMQMTWPGSPTIYYGDEAGVCGWTDPDNRRTYPWGKENLELIEFHCYLTGIRKHTPALRKGSVKELLAGKNIIAYGRFQGESRCVVIVNSGPDTMTLKVPVWQIGACDGYEPVSYTHLSVFCERPGKRQSRKLGRIRGGRQEKRRCPRGLFFLTFPVKKGLKFPKTSIRNGLIMIK